MRQLVRDLRSEASRLGFQAMGIASPSPSNHGPFLREWLNKGFHGGMAYLARPDTVARREDLRGTMEGVRTVLVVAQDYFQADAPGIPEDPSRGVIARYARGEDYHDVVKGRLQELHGWLRREAHARGLALEVRGFPYVDTGPILERDLGMRAGLGWFGKNTMLIHPKRGSYFFLGILLLDLPLPTDPPFVADHCGSCRACLDACPTGALLGRDEGGAPVMDARLCISYLTIESKGPIPRDQRPLMGNRIFGCDICQDVCPWNLSFAKVAREAAYAARSDTDGPFLMELAQELLEPGPEAFGERFSGSPVKRSRRRGLGRNVMVALGNWGSPGAVPVLARAMDDPEPLVRGHAAWALGRIMSKAGIPVHGGSEIAEALLLRQGEEEDPWVQEEITLALKDG